jgi:hypothetical protein
MWLALKQEQGDWQAMLVSLLLRLGEQGESDPEGVQK